jgi:hypothetical protein
MFNLFLMNDPMATKFCLARWLIDEFGKSAAGGTP